MTFESKHVSISINRPAYDVYIFTSVPENLPSWAAGLSGSIRKVDGDWIAESPMGTVKIEFAGKNPFGVLDHNVTLPSGETFYNPMRVVPNDNGSELTFTVYQRSGVSAEEFAEDVDAVTADLKALKKLLENEPRNRQ